MSKIIKRKWIQIRKEFRQDIIECYENNRAFTMMIIETYAASQHRKHIMKIWSLSRDYADFKQAYNENLFGRHLSGEDKMMRSLYFTDADLYQKYNRKIPECYAMAEALGVAYKALRKKN